MQSFSDVIRLWPSRGDLAADCCVPYGHVQQWERRDSIPPQYWPRLIEAAKARRFRGINADKLMSLAKPRKRAGKAA